MAGTIREIKVFLKTKTGDNKVVRLNIPEYDITLIQLNKVIQTLFDRIIQLEVNDEQITCQSGCWACCQQLVPLSIPEAYYLRKIVFSLPKKLRRCVNQKFIEAVRQLEVAHLLEKFDRPRSYSDIQEAYFRLGILCPFLEKGICLIYPDRPLACREYVVKSPRSRCKKPFDMEIEKIGIHRNLSAIWASFSYYLYRMPKDPIPLIIVFDWVNQHPFLENSRWPGVWLFEKILQGLVTLNDGRIQMSYQ